MQRAQLSNLAKYILGYWKPAIDWENGGINYEMQDFGLGPVQSDQKCLLIHARQLYDYSFGAEIGFSDSLAIADYLFSTLDKVFPKFHGSLYHSFSVDTHPTNAPYLSAYDLYYTVIALTRYSRMNKNPAILMKSYKLFQSVNNFFNDHPFQSRGCYFEYDLKNKQFRRKTGNTILHRLEALISIIDTAINMELNIFTKDQIKYELNNIEKLFINKILDPKHLIALEDFDADFKPSQAQLFGRATNSHILEWIGFWFEANQLAGYNSVFIKEHGIQAVNSAIKRGFDRQTGGFKNDHYLSENKTAETTSFWSQPEAVLGVLYANQIYSSARYRHIADKMFRFYINYFLDRKFGGIFADVSTHGIVINRSKGFAMKCDHHPIRMIDKILEWKLI